MDRRYWLSGICIAILASVPLMSAKETATKQTISVRSFSQNEVLGVLGVPIGTVVRINGVARDGNKTDFKADQGRWILEIDQVNGRPLKDIVTFRVSPKEGDIKSLGRFECYAAEYGGFFGYAKNPDKVDIEQSPTTSTSAEVSYHPRLILCKLKTKQGAERAPLPSE